MCLRSVVQHAPVGTQILVVDDASPDRAVSHTAREFAAVEVLRLERQHGFCRAVNQGLRHARGEFVEILNDDTEVESRWAMAALEAFADPAIAAVTPLVLQGPPHQGEPRIDSTGDEYHRGGFARKRAHGEVVSSRHLRPGAVFGASGSSSFFRRQVLLQVGAFPEEFGAYFDDIDLSFRLRRAGFSVFYQPASRVWHRVSASHGTSCPKLLALQSRNEELVWWRNLAPGDLLLYLSLHALVLVAKGVRRWRKGELFPFLQGRVQAWGQWRQVMRHRAKLSRPAIMNHIACQPA